LGNYIKNLSQIERFDDPINSEISIEVWKKRRSSSFPSLTELSCEHGGKIQSAKAKISYSRILALNAQSEHYAWIPLKSIQAARHTRCTADWLSEFKRVRS